MADDKQQRLDACARCNAVDCPRIDCLDGGFISLEGTRIRLQNQSLANHIVKMIGEDDGGERKKDQARTCLSSHLLPSHHLRHHDQPNTNQRVSKLLSRK